MQPLIIIIFPNVLNEIKLNDSVLNRYLKNIDYFRFKHYSF